MTYHLEKSQETVEGAVKVHLGVDPSGSVSSVVAFGPDEQ